MAQEGLVQLGRRAAPAALPAPAPDAPRVYLQTFGCQMNVADSDLIAAELLRAGFARTDDLGCADVALVNTCAVREQAEEKVARRLEELAAWRRQQPGRVVGVTGCMAEHLRDELLAIAPDVDLVAGPDSYRRIAALVAQARTDDAPGPVLDLHLDKRETYEGLDVAPGGDGVSGFLTIQRGCDKFCTFCIVPYTRGRERGTPPREVLRAARALSDAGYREVTLLGQTVNSYRWEDVRFSDLLRSVAAIPGLERIRFTSPYPIDFTPDLVEVLASEPKVCKHVHLPLQSGSDSVLARMRRGYGYAEFLEIVRALRAACADIAITTDIITGFSGETEEEHRATLRALDECAFDGAFTFKYSERDGAKASRDLPDDVPEAIKQRRLDDVIAIVRRLQLAKNEAYVGRTTQLLVTGEAKRHGELAGRTSTFKQVVFADASGRTRAGDLVEVRITSTTSATLRGELVR